MAEDPDQAADLLDELAEQAREEIAEVRRLVDGLRPPALDQFGLVSALRLRADEHNVAAGAPRAHLDDLGACRRRGPRAAPRRRRGGGVPHRAGGGEQRGPAQRRTSLRRDLRRDDRALRIQIRDAGAGLAADHRPASVCPRCGSGPTSSAAPAP